MRCNVPFILINVTVIVRHLKVKGLSIAQETVQPHCVNYRWVMNGAFHLPALSWNSTGITYYVCI